MTRHLFSRLAALALLAAPALTLANDPVFVPLGGNGHDVEYDLARGRMYVSVPSQDKIVVVDTNNWTVVNEVTVAPDPYGLALSLDGTKLFVAKRGAGAVAVLDPDTWQQSEILLGTLLGHHLTYDVCVPKPGHLYVSASPSSSGFAYIVQVDFNNGNVAQRVASNRIIRCSPTFEASRDQTALYIGECFSPASVYKLDLTQPDAPIIAEDSHGSVGGTLHLETSPDDSRVYLMSGQILDAANLNVVGQIGSGVSRFDQDPSRLFVVSAPNTIQVWNPLTQVQTDQFTLPCSLSGVRELVVLPGESGFIVLSGDNLCGVADVPTCDAEVVTTCTSVPNSSGSAATISAVGEPRIGQNDFTLTLDGAPPQRFGMFLYGSTQTQLPFGDGFLCISPFGPIYRVQPVFVIDAQGQAEQWLDFSVPPLLNGPITSGSTWVFQAWFRDPTGPGGSGINTSDAILVTFCS